MVFKIIFSATQKKTVQKDVSVSCNINDAEQILTKKFTDETEAKDVRIVGKIQQSNKGKCFALLQGDVYEHIEDEAIVEADNAKEALEAVREEYGVDEIFVKSVGLAGFEKKCKSA